MGISWSAEKDSWLKRTRGISFNELMRSELVGIVRHPRRSNQRVLLLERAGYIWEIPFVVVGDVVFLKTAFPSRKYTRKWRRGEI